MGKRKIPQGGFIGEGENLRGKPSLRLANNRIHKVLETLQVPSSSPRGQDYNRGWL